VLTGLRAERALEGATDIDDIDDAPVARREEKVAEPVNEEMEEQKQEVAKKVRRQLKG
jgi:hypothetical protein